MLYVVIVLCSLQSSTCGVHDQREAFSYVVLRDEKFDVPYACLNKGIEVVSSLDRAPEGYAYHWGCKRVETHNEG